VDATRDTRRAALLSIGASLGLVIAKLVIGIVSGSVAVLAEAAHSASDLAAAVLTLAAVRTAARPADRGHPYGHEKAENLASAVEGVLVLAAGGAVIVAAVRRLVGGGGAIEVGPALIVMAASAVVAAVVSIRLRRVARRTGSPALDADATNLGADAWTSAAILVGLALVGLTGWEPLDAIVALAVAAYILVTGARLLWASAQTLADQTLPDSELAVVEGVLARFESSEVSFHKVRGRRAGAKRHLDLHMVVPADMTVRQGHQLSGCVKRELAEALPNSEVLIHIEDE
jgi:cation diffusion facilitator family transporter